MAKKVQLVVQEFFIVQPSEKEVMCYVTEKLHLNVFVNYSFQRKFFKRVCNHF